MLLALTLVMVTAWSLRTGYMSVAQTAAQVTGQLQPAADSAADLESSLGEMRAGANAYALTGDLEDLATYIEASTRMENAFRRLRHHTKGNEELTQLLRKTRVGAEAWREQGTEPIIEAARDGDAALARSIIRSGTPRMLYNETRVYVHQLEREIRDNVDDAVESEEGQFLLLWRVLNASIMALMILLIAFAWFLFRGVLRPLKDLREQMLIAAQPDHHETPIVPSGPPELRQVGQDAEQMRRQLVDQIDRARQADEGLVQEKPVLAAIRGELYDHHEVTVPGLDVYGEQSPAEGVLAGDWWSAQHLPDGRLALIVTDVSGHGPAAGIEALRLKHVIELALAQHGNPAMALEAAARGWRDPGRFATCVALVLDPRTGLLMWANAGHHPPWVIAAARTELVPTGPMMSALGGSWINHSTQLEPGAMLAAWTDGLVESHDAEGVELGDEGLDILVHDALSTEETSHGFVKHVLAAARARAVDWQRDDVTMVAIQRI
jgi:sigma-B regulation protein RsbU (phosphoserine phosphatase)